MQLWQRGLLLLQFSFNLNYICSDDYMCQHARHFDPAFRLIDLNEYYGGREICQAVVQQLSIGTKARQISPSRKPALNYSVRVSSVEMTAATD
jgi:hypothetical protein